MVYKIGYDDVLHAQHGLTFFHAVRSVLAGSQQVLRPLVTFERIIGAEDRRSR
jgi:hypothetical protein